MLLDPRGPRFAAAVTTLVLVAILVTGSGWLALAQAAMFAVSAWSPRYAPYGLLYRAALAPRLGRPTESKPRAMLVPSLLIFVAQAQPPRPNSMQAALFSPHDIRWMRGIWMT